MARRYTGNTDDDLTPLFDPEVGSLTSQGQLEVRGQQAPSGTHHGYEQRHNVYQTGIQTSSIVGDSSSSSSDQTRETLSVCRDKVLKLYTRFLYVVGWVPAFEHPCNCLQRSLNFLHPLFVLAVIVVGYFVQYALCFTMMSDPDKGQNNTIEVPRNSSRCQEYRLVLGQEIFLDVLQFVAYGYSFYAIRFAEVEQLPTLVERVFIQTARTEMGFKTQNQLIIKLRALLYCGSVWVLLSRVGEIIHVFRHYPAFSLQWLGPMGVEMRTVMLVWMLVAFVLTDIINMAVIIHFSVQCLLLIRYINTICEKILERSLGLDAAIKEVAELYSHLRVMNQRSGLALSLILIHFANFAIKGTKALFHASSHKPVILTMFTSGLTTVLWWLAIVLPITIATYLSSRCRHLRMLGHVIRQRPFGFEDVPLAELDSFVLYMSNLNLSSQIFLIPLRIEYISLFTVIIVTLLLLL